MAITLENNFKLLVIVMGSTNIGSCKLNIKTKIHRVLKIVCVLTLYLSGTLTTVLRCLIIIHAKFVLFRTHFTLTEGILVSRKVKSPKVCLGFIVLLQPISSYHQLWLIYRQYDGCQEMLTLPGHMMSRSVVIRVR